MAGCDGNGSNSYSSTDGSSEVEQDQQCNKKVIMIVNENQPQGLKFMLTHTS